MYPRLPYATYNYLENKVNKSTDKENVAENKMAKSVDECSKNTFIGSNIDNNYSILIASKVMIGDVPSIYGDGYIKQIINDLMFNCSFKSFSSSTR